MVHSLVILSQEKLLISGIELAFGRLELWIPMRSQCKWRRPSLGWKDHKSVRERAKNLKPRWNVGCTLEKKNRAGELNNMKRPGRQSPVLVKKNSSTTSTKVNNTLKEVRLWSKSAIKRCLKYTGFTARCVMPSNTGNFGLSHFHSEDERVGQLSSDCLIQGFQN